MSDHLAFISLSQDFASRVPILGSKDGDFRKRLQLLKVVKIDLFSTTAPGRLVLISKSMVWSPESEDPLKKNRFCEKK